MSPLEKVIRTIRDTTPNLDKMALYAIDHSLDLAFRKPTYVRKTGKILVEKQNENGESGDIPLEGNHQTMKGAEEVVDAPTPKTKKARKKNTN